MWNDKVTNKSTQVVDKLQRTSFYNFVYTPLSYIVAYKAAAHCGNLISTLWRPLLSGTGLSRHL